MSKKAETRLQQRIRKALLKECGGKWFKVHGSAFQESGQPDIIGVGRNDSSSALKSKSLSPESLARFNSRLSMSGAKQGAIACIVESACASSIPG
jgi:hypothetical protein